MAIGGSEPPDVQLPEHVNNEGVSAILATGMKDRSAIVDWLASRIAEIERFTGSMPSIAVLVNDERTLSRRMPWIRPFLVATFAA